MKTANYFYSEYGNKLLTYCLVESDIRGRRFGAGILSTSEESETRIFCLGLTDSLNRIKEFLKAASENCVLCENFSEVAEDWFTE